MALHDSHAVQLYSSGHMLKTAYRTGIATFTKRLTIHWSLNAGLISTSDVGLILVQHMRQMAPVAMMSLVQPWQVHCTLHTPSDVAVASSKAWLLMHRSNIYI